MCSKKSLKHVQYDYGNKWIENINKYQNIDHANVNVSLIEESVIQINGGIVINVDVSVKSVMFVKNMPWILLHVVVKMENI